MATNNRRLIKLERRRTGDFPWHLPTSSWPAADLAKLDGRIACDPGFIITLTDAQLLNIAGPDA